MIQGVEFVSTFQQSLVLLQHRDCCLPGAAVGPTIQRHGGCALKGCSSSLQALCACCVARRRSMVVGTSRRAEERRGTAGECPTR